MRTRLSTRRQTANAVMPTTSTTTNRTPNHRSTPSNKSKSSQNQSTITQNRQILKNQLKKATVKFEKACRQLIALDRKINDLQNLYTSSMETDRKTFKIANRMQLATLEGTHEAYIEYIERKVNEIRSLKNKLFEPCSRSSSTNDDSHVFINNVFNNVLN